MNQGQALPSAYVSESSIEMRIDAVTEGLGAEFANLIRRVSKDNIVSITDFISSMKLEINISHHHKGNFIKILHKLSKFCHDKPFKEITKDDIQCEMKEYIDMCSSLSYKLCSIYSKSDNCCKIELFIETLINICIY